MSKAEVLLSTSLLVETVGAAGVEGLSSLCRGD